VANDPQIFLLERFLHGQGIFCVRRIQTFVTSLPKIALWQPSSLFMRAMAKVAYVTQGNW